MKERMREIRKEVVRKILEQYADIFEKKYASIEKQLVEQEEIGSAQFHNYTEEQYVQKKEKRIKSQIRERKAKEVRKAIDSIIKCNYGLCGETWKIECYSDEEIVGFLFALVSTKYENRRFIYKEIVENETEKYNKNLFRDLQTCNPSVDVFAFCEYILEQSGSEPKFNKENVEMEREIQILVSKKLGRCSWAESGEDICKLIKQNYFSYLKDGRLSRYSVDEIYTGVNHAEQAIEDLVKKYYLTENHAFEKLKEFFKIVERAFSIWKKKVYTITDEGSARGNIYREYAWRLLCQSTIKEYEWTLLMYYDLNADKIEKERMFDLECKQEIDKILKWYCRYQYIDIRDEKLNDAIYQNLYNEIYVDKNKWNGKTALQIVRKILRGEYERNGNLTEEILFLQAKIVRAFRNLSKQKEEEYVKIIIMLKEMLLQVWSICRYKKYNPYIIADLDYKIVNAWIIFIKNLK